MTDQDQGILSTDFGNKIDNIGKINNLTPQNKEQIYMNIDKKMNSDNSITRLPNLYSNKFTLNRGTSLNKIYKNPGPK